MEHSWWLALIALSAGFLTWTAFAYIGLRARRRSWQAWAAAYLLLIVAATYLLNAYAEDSWGVAVGTIGLLGCWAGGFVHGLAIRGEVLDVLSVDEDPRIRRARSRLLTRGAAGALAQATHGSRTRRPSAGTQTRSAASSTSTARALRS